MFNGEMNKLKEKKIIGKNEMSRKLNGKCAKSVKKYHALDKSRVEI